MCHDHDWLHVAELEGEPAADAEADEPADPEPATEERPTVEEEPALVPPADD